MLTTDNGSTVEPIVLDLVHLFRVKDGLRFHLGSVATIEQVRKLLGDDQFATLSDR